MNLHKKYAQEIKDSIRVWKGSGGVWHFTSMVIEPVNSKGEILSVTNSGYRGSKRAAKRAAATYVLDSLARREILTLKGLR